MPYYQSDPESVYPNAIDSFLTKIDARVIPETVLDSGEWVMAGHVNHLQNAVTKLEATIGTNPQGSYETVSLRLNEILGGYSALTRLGYFSGNPRMAGRESTPWPNVSGSYPFFKTIDLCLYDGTYNPYAQSILSVKNNCGVQFSIKLERDPYTNSIDESVLIAWKNLGFTRFWVLLDNIVAADTAVVNTFIDNIKVYGGLTLDVVIPNDIDSGFLDDLADGDVHIVTGDGLFIFKYTTTTANIKELSDALVSAKTRYGCETGGLSFLEPAGSLQDEYFFGIGLTYVYSLNFFGIASSTAGVLDSQTLTLYPYMPLNINYLESTNPYSYNGDEINRLVSDYDIVIDLAIATMNTTLLKIPSSFIYFDKNTTLPASIISSGQFGPSVTINPETAIADGSVNWDKINSASLDGADLATAINTNITNKINVANVAYTYTKASPATSWVITHNLNTLPSVTIIDGETGDEVFADITYDSLNQVTISFSVASYGTAHLI